CGARTAEVAVLRAVGVRARRVWWELAKESLLVGAAGVALGIPLGIGTGRLLLPLIATTTALSAKLVSTEATLTIRLSSLALAAALGLLAVVLAAALPARRAAGVAVAEALRRRGTEQAGGSGGVLWGSVIARGFGQSVIDVMPGVLRGDLAASSAHIGAGYVEAPVDEALVSDLLRVPGVAAVVGEQAIDWRYAGGPIAINAFDPAYFTNPAFGHWPLIGPQDPEPDRCRARDAIRAQDLVARRARRLVRHPGAAGVPRGAHSGGAHPGGRPHRGR